MNTILQFRNDLEDIVSQPRTIVLTDNTTLNPPMVFLSDGSPICGQKDKSWFDYLFSLLRINYQEILEKVVEEIKSYGDSIKVLQNENVYTTASVQREIQNSIKFLFGKHRTSFDGYNSECTRLVKDTIKKTIESYLQVRRFFSDRLLEGPYLDILGICCERCYSDIQDSVDRIEFPDYDKPSDVDKSLMVMTVYIASHSSRRVITLSNDHHIRNGINDVYKNRELECKGKLLNRWYERIPNRIANSKLSVIGINSKTHRLGVKISIN